MVDIEDNNKEIVTHNRRSSKAEPSSPAILPTSSLHLIRLLLNNLNSTNILGLLAGVATLIGTWFVLTAWLNEQISSIVTQRMELYQNVVIALALKNNDDNDKSISILYPALKKHPNTPIDDRVIEPFVDTYLTALANSEEPLNYTHHYHLLQTVLRNDVPEHPWRHWQLAWYTFRIGHIAGTRDLLSKALSDRRSANMPSLAADTYWLLALTYIADGNVDEALVNVKEAGLRYSVYGWNELVKNRYFFENDRPVSGLRKIYKRFSETFTIFFDRVTILAKAEMQ
jgi:tetratricopeptide (TPR) repeat protein